MCVSSAVNQFCMKVRLGVRGAHRQRPPHAAMGERLSERAIPSNSQRTKNGAERAQRAMLLLLLLNIYIFQWQCASTKGGWKRTRRVEMQYLPLVHTHSMRSVFVALNIARVWYMYATPGKDKAGSQRTHSITRDIRERELRNRPLRF